MTVSQAPGPTRVMKGADEAGIDETSEYIGYNVIHGGTNMYMPMLT